MFPIKSPLGPTCCKAVAKGWDPNFGAKCPQDQVAHVKFEPTGLSSAQVRPKFKLARIRPNLGQGRPSLTPPRARFFPLCPIHWVRAVPVAKRL